MSEFSSGELATLLLVVAAVQGAIGAVIGGSVRKEGVGFLLGFCFGPVGWIIVLLLPRNDVESRAPAGALRVRCSDCQELIVSTARSCKHCGRERARGEVLLDTVSRDVPATFASLGRLKEVCEKVLSSEDGVTITASWIAARSELPPSASGVVLTVLLKHMMTDVTCAGSGPLSNEVCAELVRVVARTSREVARSDHLAATSHMQAFYEQAFFWLLSRPNSADTLNALVTVVPGVNLDPGQIAICLCEKSDGDYFDNCVSAMVIRDFTKVPLVANALCRSGRFVYLRRLLALEFMVNLSGGVANQLVTSIAYYEAAGGEHGGDSLLSIAPPALNRRLLMRVMPLIDLSGDAEFDLDRINAIVREQLRVVDRSRRLTLASLLFALTVGTAYLLRGPGWIEGVFDHVGLFTRPSSVADSENSALQRVFEIGTERVVTQSAEEALLLSRVLEIPEEKHRENATGYRELSALNPGAEVYLQRALLYETAERLEGGVEAAKLYLALRGERSATCNVEIAQRTGGAQYVARSEGVRITGRQLQVYVEVAPRRSAWFDLEQILAWDCQR